MQEVFLCWAGLAEGVLEFAEFAFWVERAEVGLVFDVVCFHTEFYDNLCARNKLVHIEATFRNCAVFIELSKSDRF